MAEYICDVTQRDGEDPKSVTFDFNPREDIVRCRDCEFSDDDGCTLLDFTEDGWDGSGFCAWGVRKKDE